MHRRARESARSVCVYNLARIDEMKCAVCVCVYIGDEKEVEQNRESLLLFRDRWLYNYRSGFLEIRIDEKFGYVRPGFFFFFRCPATFTNQVIFFILFASILSDASVCSFFKISISPSSIFRSIKHEFSLACELSQYFAEHGAKYLHAQKKRKKNAGIWFLTHLAIAWGKKIFLLFFAQAN